MNDVRISDDLIWEDRKKEKKLKEIMKQAFEEGKKPRFHHGNLYIDGVLYLAEFLKTYPKTGQNIRTETWR